MASLLTAHLASEDEEDDDYRPDLDKTAEAEDRQEFLEQKDKRPREEEEEDDSHLLQDLPLDARQRAKKAKIGLLWDLLNGKASAEGDQPAAQAPAVAEEAAPAPAKPKVGPSNAVHLATLCRTVGAKERKKTNTDVLWMRNLGIISPKQQAAGSVAQKPAAPSSAADPGAPSSTSTQPQSDAPGGEAAPGSSKPAVSESAKAAAAAALAAAREAGGLGVVRNQNKVTVTETRRFAGKDIQVAVQVDKNSKEAAKAAERAAKPAPSSGLDAFLAEVEKKKKVNVLDKTKADWQQLKAQDTSLEEELEAHKRSGGQYLDKVDFLKRAELREYEKERDQRLASDVRTRGRL